MIMQLENGREDIVTKYATKMWTILTKGASVSWTSSASATSSSQLIPWKVTQLSSNEGKRRWQSFQNVVMVLKMSAVKPKTDWHFYEQKRQDASLLQNASYFEGYWKL